MHFTLSPFSKSCGSAIWSMTMPPLHLHHCHPIQSSSLLVQLLEYPPNSPSLCPGTLCSIFSLADPFGIQTKLYPFSTQNPPMIPHFMKNKSQSLYPALKNAARMLPHHLLFSHLTTLARLLVLLFTILLKQQVTPTQGRLFLPWLFSPCSQLILPLHSHFRSNSQWGLPCQLPPRPILLSFSVYLHNTSLIQYMKYLSYFAFHLSPPTEVSKSHEGRDFYLLQSLLYPHCLREGLAQSRCSMSICWMYKLSFRSSGPWTVTIRHAIGIL